MNVLCILNVMCEYQQITVDLSAGVNVYRSQTGGKTTCIWVGGHLSWSTATTTAW